MNLEQRIGGVLPPSFSSLGQKEQQYFLDLEQYQAPWLSEKLVQEKEVESQEDYEQRFRELKKYVALLKISQEPLGMVSTKVDNLWHQFILFTKQYHDFSRQFYGKYIHHQPNTPLTPLNNQATNNFYHWYHEVYGPLPHIWRE